MDVENKTGSANGPRYAYIDLLKTVAIFCVIVCHSAIPVDYVSSLDINTILMFVTRLFSEGVILFVMVNGFLLMPKPLNLEKHIKKLAEWWG